MQKEFSKSDHYSSQWSSERTRPLYRSTVDDKIEEHCTARCRIPFAAFVFTRMGPVIRSRGILRKKKINKRTNERYRRAEKNYS